MVFNLEFKLYVFSVQTEPRIVQLVSPPFFGTVKLNAGHAQFGLDLKSIEGVRLKCVSEK